MSRLFPEISQPAAKELRSTAFGVFFYLAAVSIAVAANDKLVHDPFKRADLIIPSSQGPADNKTVDDSFSANAQLTATLRAGKHSMVIVDGRTIGLGEEIYGHRLIRVMDRAAEFIRNKQRIILKIDKVNETN